MQMNICKQFSRSERIKGKQQENRHTRTQKEAESKRINILIRYVYNSLKSSPLFKYSLFSSFLFFSFCFFRFSRLLFIFSSSDDVSDGI